MGITRQSILRGPAAILFGGQYIYTAGDIKVSIVPDTFKIPTSMYGDVGERLKDLVVKISCTPAGVWTTALLAVLYPRTAPVVGSSIFGSSDSALVVHPLNGSEKITFTSGAVTKMPGIKLSPVETAFKEMEFTCLLKNGADRSAADALLTIADASYSDTSFSLANVLTVPYTAALSGASTPWDSFIAEGAFEIDFEEKTSPVVVANYGTVDMTFGGLSVGVKFKPVGLTVAQVLARLKVQDTGVAIGMDLSSGAANLTITGGTNNPQVVVNSVRIKSAPQLYGPDSLRHDTVEFGSTRPTGSGTIFTVGLGA